MNRVNNQIRIDIHDANYRKNENPCKQALK